MSRAAAEIEPVSRMLSSRRALPGPMRAPDSKTMLILTRAMPGTLACTMRVFEHLARRDTKRLYFLVLNSVAFIFKFFQNDTLCGSARAVCVIHFDPF